MINTPKRLVACVFSLLIAVIASSVLSGPSAHAFINTDKIKLPATQIQLYTNAWSQSISSNRKFDWMTSSKTTLDGKAIKVDTIKNTATVRVTGVAVSVSGGGVSGSGAVQAEYKLSWTNNKASISDLSGRSTVTGVVLKFSANSLAFATYKGVKNSVDIWSW